MLTRSHRFLLLSALTFGALIATNLVITSHRQAEWEQPFGLYTDPQIRRRAESLFLALAPETNGFSLHTERKKIESAAGGAQRFWEVECKDVEGNHLALFVWNADTGELCKAGYVPHISQTARRPKLQRQEDAVRQAEQWMKVLGMTAHAVSRPLFRATEWRGYWHVQWREAGDSLHIVLHRDTGQLTSAERLKAPHSR